MSWKHYVSFVAAGLLCASVIYLYQYGTDIKVLSMVFLGICLAVAGAIWRRKV